MPYRRWELVSVLGAIAVFLSISVLLIYQGAPLGHDEAVYSVRAREILNGEPTSGWWGPNRAPGLPLLLTLAWIGNGTEPYVRLIVALSGIALILSTWSLGRLMVGAEAAVVAAFGIALSPIVLMAATQVWPDVPGAALGMVAMCIYAFGLSSERFGWLTVISVVVVVGLATIVRFGAPIPTGIGLVGITVWRWPVERDRKLRVAITAIGVGVVLAVLLKSPLLTGGLSPLEGISARSSYNPVFGGFSDYWDFRNRIMAGSIWVGTVGVVVGALASVVDRRVRREFLFPFLILVATFVFLATFVHGEVRYLSPTMPWFWLCAGLGMTWAVSRLPKALAIGAGICVVGALAVITPEIADSAMEFNEGFVNIETAARSLHSESPCGVLTSYTPQVEWYSGCETVAIDTNEVDLRADSLPDGVIYLFIVENGKRQPDLDLMEAYLNETTRVSRRVGSAKDRFRYVDIWEIAD